MNGSGLIINIAHFNIADDSYFQNTRRFERNFKLLVREIVHALGFDTFGM